MRGENENGRQKAKRNNKRREKEFERAGKYR